MIYRPPISKDLPILIFERIFWGFIVFVTALIVSQVFCLKMGIVSSNTLTQGHLKVEISTLGYSTFYVLGAHHLPPSVFSSSWLSPYVVRLNRPPCAVEATIFVRLRAQVYHLQLGFYRPKQWCDVEKCETFLCVAPKLLLMSAPLEDNLMIIALSGCIGKKSVSVGKSKHSSAFRPIRFFKTHILD